jgi:hypothetical protein
VGGARPLSVVHADQLGRVVQHVRGGAVDGRHLAACADPELRRRLEAELRVELGEQAVRPIEVDPADPWNSARAAQLAAGAVPGRTLWCWWGLDPGADGEAYRRLNLARDGMAGTGTHNLVWLDEIGRASCRERVS